MPWLRLGVLRQFKGSRGCCTAESQPRQLTETPNKRRGEESGRKGGRDGKMEGREGEREGEMEGRKEGRKLSPKIKGTRDPEDPALLTQHAQVSPWVLFLASETRFRQVTLWFGQSKNTVSSDNNVKFLLVCSK